MLAFSFPSGEIGTLYPYISTFFSNRNLVIMALHKGRVVVSVLRFHALLAHLFPQLTDARFWHPQTLSRHSNLHKGNLGNGFELSALLHYPILADLWFFYIGVGKAHDDLHYSFYIRTLRIPTTFITFRCYTLSLSLSFNLCFLAFAVLISVSCLSVFICYTFNLLNYLCLPLSVICRIIRGT